ncbi:hypothetical protein F4778DRAFT_788282 [Xylariomycetidae sp. FL2044]|nr:hypothetical protein F4778DRAFT_788282 [Xylariomycetidae sp. FL2044]
MAIPIVLCGKFEEMGKLFKDAVEPDFEVIHFISSPEQGQADIPLLLSGSTAPTTPSPVGTGDYTQPPRAVVVGPNYDDAWIEALRAQMGALQVPVLKPDLGGNSQGPPSAGAAAPGPEMAKMAAQRALVVLNKLGGEGKLASKGEGGVWVY